MKAFQGTSRIGANLSALDPVLCLFGLSSNLKYLRIFRKRSRGIVFEKNKNSIFFVVEKPYGMIFSTQTFIVLNGNESFQFTLSQGKVGISSSVSLFSCVFHNRAKNNFRNEVLPCII